MFSSDSTILSVDLTGGKILTLYRSVNKPTVAIPERSPEETRGYLLTFQDKDQKLDVYAAIYLIESEEAVIYPFTKLDAFSDMKDVFKAEKAGVEFLEGFGFVMDDQNFSKKSWSEQAKMLGELNFLKGEILKVEKVDEVTKDVEVEEVSNVSDSEKQVPSMTEEEKRDLVDLLKTL